MSITVIYPDIIKTHILSKLDGATLARAAAASPLLCAEEKLWRDICIAAWPSINDPRVRHVISEFPSGYRSFFSDSSTTTTAFRRHPCTSSPHHYYPHQSTELISAVDIRYENNLIYSEVEESDDFLLVDILHSRKSAVLPVNLEEFPTEQAESISLSWILIDPTQNRSLNLSSHKPIYSQRNYDPDRIHLSYVTILPGQVGSRPNPVQCRIVVTFGGKEGGGMHVTGVKMHVQDIDGNNLSCEDSLVILQRAIQSERIKQGNERKAFEEFSELKRVRKDRIEWKDYMMDVICVVFRIVIIFILFRRVISCY